MGEILRLGWKYKRKSPEIGSLLSTVRPTPVLDTTHFYQSPGLYVNTNTCVGWKRKSSDSGASCGTAETTEIVQCRHQHRFGRSVPDAASIDTAEK